MENKSEFKVLLVEDNHDHAIIAKMALKKINKISKIKHVDNGKKALNYLFDSQTSARKLPNLTILDLNMPEIDGFQVLKEIRNDKKMNGLPVVILTTSKNESDVRKALELGVIEYFIKPIDLKRLSEILDSIDCIGNLENKNMDNLNWRTMSFIL
ncbi:MAG: response regulator [Candidatus Delongbacteria bacterium]|jgi:two-component system response regulator|nr:response regulator [Candidatus Delongbacteria bacterium]